MKCRRCGHRHDQHDSTSCNVKFVRWDEEHKRFTNQRPCNCPGYAEPYDADHTGCPHEKVKNDPACVHCGQVVAENV